MKSSYLACIAQSKQIEIIFCPFFFFSLFKIGIFVGLIVCVIVIGCWSDSVNDVCINGTDGKLMENVNDCSSYFKCNQKKAEKILCVDDSLFDAVKNSCQPPKTVTNCTNEKPTHTNDLCPELGNGIYRIPYPSISTDHENDFYILCKDGKNKGSRRKVFNDGEWVYDQRYFRDCPKNGSFKVLYEQHTTFYFLCVDGVHTKTWKITDKNRAEIVKAENLPKKPKVKNVSSVEKSEDYRDKTNSYDPRYATRVD